MQTEHRVRLNGHRVTFILQPWQLLFLVLSAWVNRQQQQVIDFYISQTYRSKDLWPIDRNFDFWAVY